MMLDDPGSFYKCTETSPRCFVIEKVPAKDLSRVFDELGGLSLDEVGDVNSSAATRGGNNDPTSAGRNESAIGGRGGIVVRGQAVGSGAANMPPVSIFPAWWSPEAEKELEAIASVTTPCGACANGGEDQQANDYGGVTLAYHDIHHHHPLAHHHHHQPVNSNIIEEYGGADGHQEGVIEFVVDTNGDASRIDIHSPSTAVDQQLHVSVDQYPVTVVYPSVVSSPSNNDQTMISGGMDAASGGEQQESEAAKWAPPSPGASMDLSLEELKTRVRHQLEYYFSRENLAADAYLRSQMDNDQFVKVTTLASFNMVKRLTTDFNLILEAIRESPVLQVNETGDKVRPIHKRCTLILREIPEGTKKEEVEQLFSGPQCPKIVSSEIALQNIWYVNFETDEDAQRAFLYLRQKVQCFKGKPIMARIKTAPIPRVQHNGSRPPVPNTLPLHNTPYPTVSPPPNAILCTGPLMMSPSNSCAFGNNASTPFSTGSGGGNAAGFGPPMADGGGNVVIDSSVNVPSTSPMCYYPPSQLQAPIGFTPTGGVGSLPAAAMNSSSWPSPDPGTFDLGYILAEKGFQAQGAYRPAVFLPNPSVSPACHASAGGPRYPGSRPPSRKPRGGMSYTPNHSHGDRTGAQSADSGRPPPSYNRYGTTSGARSANAGYYADRRGSSSQYWNYDNIHYDGMRRRPPNRFLGVTNNYGGGGGGGGGIQNDPRPRHVQRADRQGRFSAGYESSWNNNYNGNYQSRPFRRASAIATAPAVVSTTTSTSSPANTVVAHGKKTEDSFDLQLASFPPLPTATVETEKDESQQQAMPTAKENDIPTVVEPTQILQREYGEKQQHNSAITSSSSPTANFSITTSRMKSASITVPAAADTIEDNTMVAAAAAAIISSHETAAVNADGNTAKARAEMVIGKGVKHCPKPQAVRTDYNKHDHAENCSSFSITAQKGIPGFGATKAGNAMIPVAVVQPNSQQKATKIATADKSTTTDLSPPMPRARIAVDGEQHVPKRASSENEANQEDKTASDGGKKLSYADMAKHAAGRGGGSMTLVASAIAGEKPTTATISTNCTTGGSGGHLAPKVVSKGVVSK